MQIHIYCKYCTCTYIARDSCLVAVAISYIFDIHPLLLIEVAT